MASRFVQRPQPQTGTAPVTTHKHKTHMNITSQNGIKIVYNTLLPFPGFVAMMLFGTIFARSKYAPLPADTIRHELIHRTQAAECGGWIRYYLLYIWLWLRYGYRNNPMEREAFRNMFDKKYLDTRQTKAWRNYVI